MKTENIDSMFVDKSYFEGSTYDKAKAELAELKRLAEIGERYTVAAEMHNIQTLQERQTIALERIADALTIEHEGSLAEGINGHLYVISENVKR